jgi:cytochrome c-type biogenesis protein CcmH/NrfG
MDHTTSEECGTLAEGMGLTAELAEAIQAVAAGELEAGRVEAARTILEGLVISNPRDGQGWVLLARVHQALRHPLAARFCAEVATSLAPADPAVQLVRAEGQLAFSEERAEGRRGLQALAGLEGFEGERARALLGAMEG